MSAALSDQVVYVLAQVQPPANCVGLCGGQQPGDTPPSQGGVADRCRYAGLLGVSQPSSRAGWNRLPSVGRLGRGATVTAIGAASTTRSRARTVDAVTPRAVGHVHDPRPARQSCLDEAGGAGAGR